MEKTIMLKLLITWLQLFHCINAYTHWVVTENGRIQAQLETPFNLRRPDDLLALLGQEKRLEQIHALSKEMEHRKAIIQKKTTKIESFADVEARVYSQKAECRNYAKFFNVDLYLSMATNGSDRPGITFDVIEESSGEFMEPDCANFMQLDFSIFAYEHLKVMLNRSRLVMNPEKILERIMPVPDVADFANQIILGLRMNSSSWVHYNLGLIYWRIMGDAPKAVDCARRALHTVPRQYRDIPLLNLAQVFHLSRESDDAIILLQAAIDHAPSEPNYHLALAYVYSAVEDYQKSVDCFEQYLKLYPDPEVYKIKEATVCFAKLESGIMELHEFMEKVLNEMYEYQALEQKWFQLEERLTWEHVSFESQLSGYNSDKSGSVLPNQGQRCVQKMSKDQKPTITCDFASSQTSKLTKYLHNNDIIEPFLQVVQSSYTDLKQKMSLIKSQRVQKKTTKKQGRLKIENNVNKNVVFDDKLREIGLEFEEFHKNVLDDLDVSKMVPLLPEKYPTAYPIPDNLYFDQKGWPNKDECVQWNLPISGKDYLKVPVYLPPENKGYQITKILSEAINVPENQEHELPWYPPNCLDIKSDINMFLKFDMKPNEELQHKFLQYINKGNTAEAEIGQRIVTAVQKKTAPLWLLSNVASLYWRVKGNLKNAMRCLLSYKSTIPKEHQDILLVSLASLTHEAGLIDQAITIANLAFKVNFVEPSTNFLLGLLHYENGNILPAMFYMKNALRVDSNYHDGLAEHLLKTWACRLKLGSYEDNLGKKLAVHNEEMCKEGDSFNSEGVVCSANGDQCKTASLYCVKTDSASNANMAIVKGKSLKHQCEKYKVQNGHTSRSQQEGSVQLEKLVDAKEDDFRMRISFGDESSTSDIILDDFYISYDPNFGATYQIKDYTGSYILSQQVCKNLETTSSQFYMATWQALEKRGVDISKFLSPLAKADEDLKPYCRDALPLSQSSLNNMLSTILQQNLPNLRETNFYLWLGLMAKDQNAPLKQLGAQIGKALKENTTSWILATAAALYWRVVGNNAEALLCFQQALSYVPPDKADIPMFSMADLLNALGYPLDAVEAGYRALEYKTDFVLNHFMLAIIHQNIKDVKKAILLYQTSLKVDPNFSLSRNRLHSVYCTFFFDENGVPRDPMEFV